MTTKIIINGVSDFDGNYTLNIEKEAHRDLVARLYLRRIISANNKAICKIVDSRIQGSGADVYAIFFNTFNNGFAKYANEFEGQINTTFHKYYFQKYRFIQKCTNLSYYRHVLEKKYADLDSAYKNTGDEGVKRFLQNKMRIINDTLKYRNTLNSNVAKINDCFKVMPKPIDLADLYTLASYIEYQNAFVRYSTRHNTTLEATESNIKNYLHEFVRREFTILVAGGDGKGPELRAFKYHKPLPVADKTNDSKEDYDKVIDMALDVDGVSAIYSPYHFGIKGDYDIDILKCEPSNNNSQSLSDFELKVDMGDKTSKFNRTIQDYILSRLAEQYNKYHVKTIYPSQVLLHFDNIDADKYLDNYYGAIAQDSQSVADRYYAFDKFNYFVSNTNMRQAQWDSNDRQKVANNTDNETIDEMDDDMRSSEYVSDNGQKLYYNAEHNLVTEDGIVYTGEVNVINSNGELEVVINPNNDYDSPAD